MNGVKSIQKIKLSKKCHIPFNRAEREIFQTFVDSTPKATQEALMGCSGLNIPCRFSKRIGHNIRNLRTTGCRGWATVLCSLGEGRKTRCRRVTYLKSCITHFTTYNKKKTSRSRPTNSHPNRQLPFSDLPAGRDSAQREMAQSPGLDLIKP